MAKIKCKSETAVRCQAAISMDVNAWIKKVLWSFKNIGFLLLFLLLMSGCGSDKTTQISPQPEAKEKKADLTIMHVDRANPGMAKFMKEAEEKLGITIKLIECPDNADNRQALISTILKSGDDSVDIITVNDEMISEFKHKGYLYPLSDSVMTEQVRAHYPEDYLKEICMLDGEIYSVPYLMDVMCFWVNQEVLNQAGMSEISDFSDFKRLAQSLATESKDSGVFAFGDAWETTYIYNAVSQFINLCGGDYHDWSNEKTMKAIRLMKEMLDQGITPEQQFVDQYEQMEEKFIAGKYGCIFMYSGSAMVFVGAGKYGENQIHLAPMPGLDEYATNIATWQYVLNNASGHKDAAIRFLNYVASKEGALSYAAYTGCFPARMDVADSPDFQIVGGDEIRHYLSHAKLCARPMSSNSMVAISASGSLFQKYLLGEMEEEEFRRDMQKVVEMYY